MKAIVQRSYGPPEIVLSVDDLPEATPDAGHVKIRIHASSINKGDWHAVVGRPWLVRPAFGLTRPTVPVPGRDVAGVVEEVGPGATRFKAGDAVIAEVNQGAWAETVCAPEKDLALKPDGISFEMAATLPVAATTALQGLRDHGKLAAGEKVLINGASGNVGSFAVQVAKVLGAAEVTAVCSTRNVDTARRLGADEVVDYTVDDFTATEKRYDLIFDIAGSRPVGACTRLLTSTGRFVNCSGGLGRIAQTAVISIWNRSVVGPWVANGNQADASLLLQWAAEGRIDPAIVRTIELPQIPEALRQQGEGRSQGKTVVRIAT